MLVGCQCVGIDMCVEVDVGVLWVVGDFLEGGYVVGLIVLCFGYWMIIDQQFYLGQVDVIFECLVVYIEYVVYCGIGYWCIDLCYCWCYVGFGGVFGWQFEQQEVLEVVVVVYYLWWWQWVYLVVDIVVVFQQIVIVLVVG